MGFLCQFHIYNEHTLYKPVKWQKEIPHFGARASIHSVGVLRYSYFARPITLRKCKSLIMECRDSLGTCRS